MIAFLIGIIAFMGMANILYYEHRVIRKPQPKVLGFVGYKFKKEV